MRTRWRARHRRSLSTKLNIPPRRPSAVDRPRLDARLDEGRNDGWAWAGTSVGTTDSSGGGGNVTYHQLVGNGGYEGVSAVVFERETPAGVWIWDGVVIPEDLPRDR
jgi:hypothetical protein